MRLFVAVTLPDSLSEPIAALQSALPDPLRRTDPSDAHLTLKFLGETPAGGSASDSASGGGGTPDVNDARRAVRRAVADAGVAPFTATLGGLGVFPSLDYVRVVWIGARDGIDELTRLADAVERETTAAGFDGRDHAFTPHVTLARMDDARGKDRVRELVEGRDPDVGTVEVEAVHLMESVLTDEGPVYRTVERVPLES